MESEVHFFTFNYVIITDSINLLAVGGVHVAVEIVQIDLVRDLVMFHYFDLIVCVARVVVCIKPFTEHYVHIGFDLYELVSEINCYVVVMDRCLGDVRFIANRCIFEMVKQLQQICMSRGESMLTD